MKRHFEAIVSKCESDSHLEIPFDFDVSDFLLLVDELERRAVQIVTANLEGSRVEDFHIRHLVKSPSGGSLESLRLGMTDVTNTVADYLAGVELKSLCLKRTKIDDKAINAICDLTSLTLLRLDDTYVTDEGVESMANDWSFDNLQTLALDNTSVGDASLRAIANCEGTTSLRHLSLSGTLVGDDGLSEFAEGSCCHLTTLNLNGTNVTGTGLKKLSRAKTVDDLETLFVESTEVRLPVYLQHRTEAKAILGFFRKTVEGGHVFEITVPVLGQGRSGKSVLLRHIAHADVDELLEPFVRNNPSTHGFASKDIFRSVSLNGRKRQIRVKFLDFGGQSHMHASHHLFLEQRHPLYVAVANSRNSMDENYLDYWLRMIAYYGRGAPVIVVVTHCDDHPAADDLTTRSKPRRLQKLDATQLSETYSLPVKVIDGYSNREGNFKQIVDVLDTMIEAVIPNACNTAFPSNYFQLKNWLEGTASEALSEQRPFNNYISFTQDFVAACKHVGQIDSEKQRSWLQSLRDLGVLLWSGDRGDVERDPRFGMLRDLIFRPDWLRGPLYRAANDHADCVKPGVLSGEQLESLLMSSGVLEVADTTVVIAIMLEYELCFKIRGSENHYLMIDRISDKPKEFITSSVPAVKKYLLTFSFLPAQFLGRLLGRWFEYVDETTDYYRDQVVFLRDNVQVRLTSSLKSHQLHIEYFSKTGLGKLHARLTDELERMANSAQLSWTESEVQATLGEELTGAERILVDWLGERLPQVVTAPLSKGEISEFKNGLRERFLLTGSLPNAQRLAYRACYVVYCFKTALGEAMLELGDSFPFAANAKQVECIGAWLEDQAEIRRKLLSMCKNPKLATLDRGEGKRPFDSLRKSYSAAVKAIDRPKTSDLTRHARPRYE